MSKHKNHLPSFGNYRCIYHFNEEKWAQEGRIHKKAINRETEIETEKREAFLTTGARLTNV